METNSRVKNSYIDSYVKYGMWYGVSTRRHGTGRLEEAFDTDMCLLVLHFSTTSYCYCETLRGAKQGCCRLKNRALFSDRIGSL